MKRGEWVEGVWKQICDWNRDLRGRVSDFQEMLGFINNNTPFQTKDKIWWFLEDDS